MSEMTDVSNEYVEEKPRLDAPGPSTSHHSESIENKIKALLCSIQQCSQSVIEGIETSVIPSKNLIKTYLGNLISSLHYLKNHGPKIHASLQELCQICDDMLRDIETPVSKLPLLSDYKIEAETPTGSPCPDAPVPAEESAIREVLSNLLCELNPQSPADSQNTGNSGSMDVPLSPCCTNPSPSPFPLPDFSLSPTPSETANVASTSTDPPSSEGPDKLDSLPVKDMCKNYRLDELIIPISQFRTVRQHYQLIVDAYKNFRESMTDVRDLAIDSDTRISAVLVPIGFDILEDLVEFLEFVAGKAESSTAENCDLNREELGVAYVKEDFKSAENVEKKEKSLQLYEQKMPEIINVACKGKFYGEVENKFLKETEDFITTRFHIFQTMDPCPSITGTVTESARSLRYFCFHMEGLVLSCIDTTKAILDFCSQNYTKIYDCRMRRFLINTLKVFRSLVSLRKSYYDFQLKVCGLKTPMPIERILDFKAHFLNRFELLLQVIYKVNLAFWFRLTVIQV